MAARLKEKYHKEIKQALQKELGLENHMAVPQPTWRTSPARSR
jgi:large subunit ribosomal protein L5